MKVVPRTNIKKNGAFSPTRSRSLASATTVDTTLSRHSSCKDPLDSTEDGSEAGSYSGRIGDGDFDYCEERSLPQLAPSRPPGLITRGIFSHVPQDSPHSNFLSTPAPQQLQDATRQLYRNPCPQHFNFEPPVSSTAHHASASSRSIYSTVPSAWSTTWENHRLPCPSQHSLNVHAPMPWQEHIERSVFPETVQTRSSIQAIPGGCDKPLKVYMEYYDCEVAHLDPHLPAKKRLPDWFS
mmetsp:Transcript_55685/g.86469  ORF Transcript_55685/g.86469 Transcript_55685/m.86469 type:complete len:239 (+) Transcript_55685:67-783(+)